MYRYAGLTLLALLTSGHLATSFPTGELLSHQLIARSPQFEDQGSGVRVHMYPNGACKDDPKSQFPDFDLSSSLTHDPSLKTGVSYNFAGRASGDPWPFMQLNRGLLDGETLSIRASDCQSQLGSVGKGDSVTCMPLPPDATCFIFTMN